MVEEKKKLDPRKLRNLTQYKGMSDEEFQKQFEILSTPSNYEDFQVRVREKYSELEKDYDLSDMKFNDTETLMDMCSAMVTVDENKRLLVDVRAEGMTGYNLTIIKEVESQQSTLRKDISKMQDDLKITRKIRKATKEESAKSELKRLKTLAMEFYKQKMFYVYCEKCHQLLSTTWFLFPDSINTLSLKCLRPLDEKSKNICGHITKIKSKKLVELRGTNHHEGFDF